MKKGCSIGQMTLLFAYLFAQQGVAQGQIFEGEFNIGRRYVPCEVIVEFKSEFTEHEIDQVNSRHGTSEFYRSPFARFRRLAIPRDKTVAEMVELYNGEPAVRYAEANHVAYALWSPNDEYYPYQWHFHAPEYGGIGMEQVWEISTGSTVLVAVVDTGIAYEDYCTSSAWWKICYDQAPDLAETCFVAGYDFVNNDAHANDDSSPGHGTHVAGTIAQSTDNRIGTAGVAFSACLMPVKVLDSAGSGTYADIADGIRFAVDSGAHVINLSLGGSDYSVTLEEAVAYAYNNGVTVVAAAGNDGRDVLSYPAAYDDYVISVGATQYDHKLAPYSNYGPALDLVAPGGNLDLDQNGDGYGDGVLQQTYEKIGWSYVSWGYYLMDGTSMAAPHISGVAALLIANGNATSPDDVRAALQETARDLGTAGRDDTYGWGIVDPYAALQWSSEPVDYPPSVMITSPADGAIVSGPVTITADAVDDTEVEKVEFFVDGSPIGISYTSVHGIDWDSTTVGDGSHVIKATATDNASQTASDSVSVTVDNVNDPPVADAGPDQTVSDADGDGAETVSLDASVSYDPDGVISAYRWAEGSTELGATATITCDFGVGTHTVTLTVEDNEGATDSDTVVVIVNANQAPSAHAGSDQTVSVGDTVGLSGSGSSDPDGSIVSYDWDFGDGKGGTGVSVTHEYSATGTYTVTLTVTDDGGLTGQDTALITVTEPSATVMHVESIEMEVAYTFFQWIQVQATILIHDDSGNPVSRATVTGDWSGAYYDAKGVSGTTDDDGTVSFRSQWGSGTFMFTVTDVSKSGWTYDPSKNKESNDSITP